MKKRKKKLETHNTMPITNLGVVVAFSNSNGCV